VIADLRAEWGKLWSLRSPRICLLAAMLLVPATAYTLANDTMYDVAQGRMPADTVVAPLDVLGSALQFGLAMFVAFAMMTTTSEYATGSIRSTLLAEPRRWRVMLAKTAVVASTAGLAGAVVGVGTYWVIQLVLGNNTAAGPSELDGIIRAAVLVGLAAILTSGVAALVRSSVGTLALTFGILVGTLVVPEPLGPWLPASAGADWLTLADGRALAVLTSWAAAAWIAGWYALERRDA
jgi:ABC-2 type transport system permease protein